mgnify:CR=1 FL=1
MIPLDQELYSWTLENLIKNGIDAIKGKVDVTLGDYDLAKARGGINLPLSDSVATRFSWVITDQDGFSENLVNGQDLDDTNHSTLRSDWLFDLSDTSSLRLFKT